MNLADFLIEHRFQRIELAKNGVGHFQTVGDLGGRPLSVHVGTRTAAKPGSHTFCGGMSYAYGQTIHDVRHRIWMHERTSIRGLRIYLSGPETTVLCNNPPSRALENPGF